MKGKAARGLGGQGGMWTGHSSRSLSNTKRCTSIQWRREGTRGSSRSRSCTNCRTRRRRAGGKGCGCSLEEEGSPTRSSTRILSAVTPLSSSTAAGPSAQGGPSTTTTSQQNSEGSPASSRRMKSRTSSPQSSTQQWTRSGSRCDGRKGILRSTIISGTHITRLLAPKGRARRLGCVSCTGRPLQVRRCRRRRTGGGALYCGSEERVITWG
mmetsp:Transcript_45347/g.92633  ORF Transcript_45347/g.92633 Transcript_45347/m.92633 type:complete len:211 (+) Transcript_45347:712-1344(+)